MNLSYAMTRLLLVNVVIIIVTDTSNFCSLYWNTCIMIKHLFYAGIASAILSSTAFAASTTSPSHASQKYTSNNSTVLQIKIPVVKDYNVSQKFRAQTVEFSGYKPGTIVIDPKNYFLYYVESSSKARRYGIAVGRQGLEFQGNANIKFKREWPRWIPTKEMVERSPENYGNLANGMDGGPSNPLGARALYLWQNNKDTYIRIHGTTQPWTIGSSASNGCFRMTNEDVLDLYDRVNLGSEVIVL